MRAVSSVHTPAARSRNSALYGGFLGLRVLRSIGSSAIVLATSSSSNSSSTPATCDLKALECLVSRKLPKALEELAFVILRLSGVGGETEEANPCMHLSCPFSLPGLTSRNDRLAFKL